MGLDAYVSCRCFVEGRARPFAHPEFLRTEHGMPELTVEWTGNEQVHLAFERWKDSACEHPSMELATERISNWSGYRMFQQALADVGWQHFPTLHAELPQSNGGVTEPAAARVALGELAVFEARLAGDNVVLVDSDSGEKSHDYIAVYDGVFVWSGKQGVELGFDPHGVFVRRGRKAGGDELFRAQRIEITAEEIIDRDAGTRLAFVANWGVGRRFHVERQPLDAAEFDHILTSLRVVFHAAVVTGGSVFWC